tara:strand:+ start:3543 stop:5246 length:1704 start_codon:yes stop_codon:yes gene_type:complete
MTVKLYILNFIKILIISLWILPIKNSFSRDWIPNQVGAFLSSKIARSITDVESSAYFAKYAYNRNTESNGLALIALEALIANGQINEAIKIGIKVANKMEGISLVQHINAINYIDKKNYAQALEIYKNISPDGIDKYILPILQAWIEAESNKSPEGLTTISKEAEKGILTPIYGYHAALINEYLGNDEIALENYKNVIDRSNSANAIVFIKAALFFERLGKNNLKNITLNKLERLDPYSNELISFNNDKSLKYLNLLTSPRDGIAEILLNSAELLYNEGLNLQALTYAQMSKYLNSNQDEANYLLGRIFDTIENKDRALKYFKTISDNSYVTNDAKIYVAEIIYAKEGINNSINYLSNLKSNNPNNINFSRTVAELYYKEEDFNNSIKTYKEIINNIDKIEYKHWPLLYSYAISLERGKNWNEAEKYFLLTLEFVPNNPQVLNYLGYSWIDQGINIEKALSMIIKAVEQRPNDGYIVDSLGWAYYQTGDYEKAVENLEKASELLSDSIVVDHLGDALFYSGRKTEAIFQWKRALKFNPSKELKKQLEDKINGKITPKEGVNAGSKSI